MGDKHRIAMVVASAFPGRGGTAVAVKEMSEALAAYGHEVHLVVYDHGLQNVELDPSIHLHRAPRLPLGQHFKAGPSFRKPFWDVMLTWRLLQVVRAHQIEIIHTHNYEAPIAGYIVRRLTHIPVIYHAHNTMTSELHTYYSDTSWVQYLVRRFAFFLDRRVPVSANYVIAITEEIMNNLLEYGVAAHKMSYIPLGLNLAPFSCNQRGILDNEYGLKGRVKVVYTGILDEFQEIDKLIRAFYRVHEEIPESVLVLAGKVGSKAYRTICGQLMNPDGIRVIEDPSFTQVVRILADADVTVLPRTVCPGIPIKLLNYMASSKPTVAFSGSAKGLRHLENGLVVKDGDVEAFSAAIIRLLRDEELRTALGARGRQTVEGECDWAVAVQHIGAIYDKVLLEHENS